MDVYMFQCSVSASISINVSASSSISISANASASVSMSASASASVRVNVSISVSLSISAKCIGNEPSRYVVSTPGWPRSLRVPQEDSPRPVIQNLIERLITGNTGFGSLEE